MPISLKDCIKKLMLVNPQERPTADEILSSDIFRTQTVLDSKLSSEKHAPSSVSLKIRNTESPKINCLKRHNTGLSTVDSSLGYSKQSILWTPEGPKPRSKFARTHCNSPKDKTESSFMTKQRKSSFATAEDSTNADQNQTAGTPLSKFSQYHRKAVGVELHKLVEQGPELPEW